MGLQVRAIRRLQGPARSGDKLHVLA